MKKSLSLLLILILSTTLLTSCGTNSKVSTEEKPQTEEITPPPKKEPNPNLPTKTTKEIDEEMSKISTELENYLKTNSDTSKLTPSKVPNGTGAMYQDILFSSLTKVNGPNEGSFHVSPSTKEEDSIMLVLGLAFDEDKNKNQNPPQQLEEMFKIVFPKEVTQKKLSEYITELNGARKTFTFGNNEFIVAKSKKSDGRTLISIGYKYLLNIENNE
ncbi:MAG: hypothetical protein ACRC2K_01615 [Clostridium sp.]